MVSWDEALAITRLQSLPTVIVSPWEIRPAKAKLAEPAESAVKAP
jgi:hypothetical protein